MPSFNSYVENERRRRVFEVFLASHEYATISVGAVKLARIDNLVAAPAEQHELRVEIKRRATYHILRHGGQTVWAHTNERGGLLYGVVRSGHHHEDDGVLTQHFIDSVAALLNGEMVCDACSSSRPSRRRPNLTREAATE